MIPEFLICIICYKCDFFLTKICCASIRYYYPHIKICIVKDEEAGKFSTKELEKYFDIEVVNLEKKKFGWTSAKVFLFLSKKRLAKKILILDSDVVFVGKVLDKIFPHLKNNDFLVNPEYKDKPGDKNFDDVYYDYKYFSKKYPQLEFPGFTFNSGNIVITQGLISKNEIKEYFLSLNYPYWTALGLKLLPLRDQSLLNIILPLKAKNLEISLKKIKFMYWYKDIEVKSLSLRHVMNGRKKYLIHWAGAERTAFLPRNEGAKFLIFFQKKYYSKIPFGKMRYYFNVNYQKFMHTFQ